MKTKTAFLVFLLLSVISQGQSQTHKPVSRINSDGIFQTLGVVLKFNCPVLIPERGVRNPSLNDIEPQYQHIKLFLQNLAASYGNFKLIKQIPSETWGDTLKTRISDGVLVPVKDMSQLYYLQFSEYIYIDDILEEILELPEVAYAHPPVEAVNLADPPSDPLYSG